MNDKGASSPPSGGKKKIKKTATFKQQDIEFHQLTTRAGEGGGKQRYPSEGDAAINAPTPQSRRPGQTDDGIVSSATPTRRPGQEDDGITSLQSGMGARQVSYAQRVNDWSEHTERNPDESSAVSLSKKARQKPKRVTYSKNVSLLTIGTNEASTGPLAGPDGGRARDVSNHRNPSQNFNQQPQMPKRVISRLPSKIPGLKAKPSLHPTASTIQGKRTVRLSIIPTSAGQFDDDTTVSSGDTIDSSIRAFGAKKKSFAPKTLIDIENGKSILVTSQAFLPSQRFQQIDEEGAIVVASKQNTLANADEYVFDAKGSSLKEKIFQGEVASLEMNSEVGMIGGMWRGALRRLILSQYDGVSGLRLSRQMQAFAPFQTSLETYLILEFVAACDDDRKKDLALVLKTCLRNRNVSRIIIQNLGPRFDFWWHWYTAVNWNRVFDGWGQFPIVGITSFPATENFPSTRNHALGSIFRVLLGEGNWLTRVLTGGREGFVVDDPKTTAQNLAAESNGFETANRNQFGNYIGRMKTNEFRFNHRLPTDESIVRTFISSPQSTLTNNGVEHVLRCLAKHWHNMLYQDSGNFAHQRMEQLDIFEIMRFHMPVVLVTLSQLRGGNKWDSKVLAPYLRKLQHDVKPSFTTETIKYLCNELLHNSSDNIINNVCAGLSSRIDPFRSWVEAILLACDQIEDEAKLIYEIVSSVEIGIRLGYDVITQINWSVPTDRRLKDAIIDYIKHKEGKNEVATENDTVVIKQQYIQRALLKIQPRDKRTLIELVNNGFMKSKPCQLLLGRAKTLLIREIRRGYLNSIILDLSMGDYIDDSSKPPMHDEWYWVEEDLGDGKKKADMYIYDAKVTGRNKHRFLHVNTKYEKFMKLGDDSNVKLREYVPVAEAISRAQRAFMNIELDHGKKFKYNAFMEFTFLRDNLRKLLTIAQMNCDVLDDARLNILAEIQRANQAQISIKDLVPGEKYFAYDEKTKTYDPFVAKSEAYSADDPEWRKRIVTVPPQNMIVIGGGPTGLTTTIHCTENVLMSGGKMKLYESRDAFAKGGATFERAQIVRLDSRWIAMLRYHLGTGFEDVYIPATGETDSQLGNTLPTQGFVEITIKDLENMLHVELSRMWSKGLLQVHTQAGARYDHHTNTLTKLGSALKIDDLIHRRVDPDGVKSEKGKYYSWRVVDMEFGESLPVDQLQIGQEYGVYNRLDNAINNYKLMGIDLSSETYTFKPMDDEREEIQAKVSNMPSIYPKGITKHSEVKKIIVECVQKGDEGGYVRDELPYKAVEKQKFSLDIGHYHVVEAIGKPHGSDVHFSVTTYEPYGVCCIQGLKVSMGLHNFGEKRWGQGILDDVRSHTDQNTRVIGDFTKMVRSAPITDKMLEYMTDKKDETWQMHWVKLCEDNGFGDLNEFEPIVPKIQKACEQLSEAAPDFKRKTLQTRFFETGDNYYLGMEFTREYDTWKNNLVDSLVAPLFLKYKDEKDKKKVGRFRGLLAHHIDRLWYDGCLEVIRTGDVYNPGARKRVPRMYLINRLHDSKLGNLPVGESFRISADLEAKKETTEKYEVVIQGATQVIVRNVEGYIHKMNKNTKIRIESNLTRGPDGNAESKVSLATFPVGHYVNFRTLRLNDESKGYVFAFIGDEQATPHFMRYSGLTGACINSMLINNFVKQAIDGVPFIERFQIYSKETNWSNGEVVQRGTGANYGQDGFLRPGFPYKHAFDYLHSKVIEYMESGQDLDNIVSRDWKVKLAASLVPRGMELNEQFIQHLYSRLRQVIMDKFIAEVMNDKSVGSEGLKTALISRASELEDKRGVVDIEDYWDEFVFGLDVDRNVKDIIENPHAAIAIRLEQICDQIIAHATQQHIYNERVSSELFNQPKPVDSVVDDFAVEAQSFANALTLSATFSAGAVCLGWLSPDAGRIFSAILGALNILISFGTMANVARYKIRNEAARVIFQDKKMLNVMKGVYSIMDRADQDQVSPNNNPFIITLKQQKDAFLKNVKYYDYAEPKDFLASYDELVKNINDPYAIQNFMDELTGKYIVDTYHVSSYLQEDLVNIYKSCDELKRFLVESTDKSGASEARALFQRLQQFRPKLENSLQRGPTKWGFLQTRKLSQWDIVVVFKYFYGLLCCSSRKGGMFGALISTETLGIVKQASYLSSLQQSSIMRREVRDLDALYWATNESSIASLIFVTGFCVFIASILFTIARIGEAASPLNGFKKLEEGAEWALLASSFGAILAAFHFVRKITILLSLYFTLGGKVKESNSIDTRSNVKHVKGVTFTQIFLTLIRLGAATAAAVCLPWALAEQARGSADLRLPGYVAVGAVGAAVASTIIFFAVEYVVRYHLEPKLGEYVCELFRAELEAMHIVLDKPQNDVDSKQVQERETWEYVAREFLHKYRFDTVFAADRFGSILQYIQSGLDSR